MKKQILPMLILLTLTVNLQNVYGALNPVEVKEALVTSAGLNVRSGPGVKYQVIGQVLQGDRLTVLGEADSWYLVELGDGSFGMVYSPFTESVAFHEEPLVQGDTDDSGELTDTQAIFSYANTARADNGLTPFTWDEELNAIALLKADDMVKNEYFDHSSPTYGTPFKMLKQMGVVYNSASENLVANPDILSAHNQIMASPAHRSNVLSPRFNKMGVAVLEHAKYGKIIVQLFVEE